MFIEKFIINKKCEIHKSNLVNCVNSLCQRLGNIKVCVLKNNKTVL